jgi:ferrochelatase
MKHSPPFIEDGAAEAAAKGVRKLVGLPLAPHFSRLSLGEYESRLRLAWSDELVVIRGFHDHPAFIAAVAQLLRESLESFQPERLFFTAHSLPERILREQDPYVDQLLESCRLVADAMRLPPWELAFQSRSSTGEPWLGPDIIEAMARSRARRVLVCPIGFVADHLEILYDLDVEAQESARRQGIELRRTASFNARPEFLDALAAVVSGRLGTPVAA